MIIKYGTPAPAEMVDIKNVPAWVKNTQKEQEDKKAESSEKEDKETDKDEE